MEPTLYSNLCDALKINALSSELLDRVFTHSSAINERGLPSYYSNERLEYLGDAVLELAVSDQLYQCLPRATEGELTQIRAELVCEANLAERARELKLGAMLTFGHGEQLAGGAHKPALLADALEALFGAIFLTHGYETAYAVIKALLIDHVDLRQLMTKSSHHWKTRLQELVQQGGPAHIEYRVDQSGSDHRPVFVAHLFIEGEEISSGTGHSKKEAEQQAAKKGFEILAGKKRTRPKR